MADVSSGKYVDTWGWNARFAAYKFAQGFKWYCVLNVLGQAQTREIAPHAANSSWGLIVSLGAAWAAFGPALFGDWSDRIRKRRGFVIAGLCATLLLLAWLSQATALWMLFVGYFLVQVADDVAEGPYGGALPEVVPQEKRGFASAVIGQLSLAAQVLGGVAMTLVSHNIPLAYAVVGGVAVLGSALTLTVLPEPPPRAAREPKPFWQGYLAPWQHHDFRVVWTTRLLAAVGAYVITTYLLNFLSDAYWRDPDGKLTGLFGLRAEPRQAVALILLTISISGVAGALVAARKVDRWGRKPMMSAAGTLIAVLLIPFMLSRSLELTMLLGVGFGVVYGAYMSAEWALASDVMPNPDELSKDMGLWSSSAQFGQLLVGLVGPLIDFVNRRAGSPSGYMVSVGVAAVLFLTAAVLIRQIRGTR